MHEDRTLDLRAIERAFLFAFIALRLLLFARMFGQYIGYDVRGHLQVVSAISWTHPFLSPRALYYAVHPPLGFLLAHSLTMLGMVPILAAQTLSFLASLVAFFFMRSTLKSLGLLGHLPAVVFLYLAASIPMQIYLSVIVSLDVFVLACMSIILFLSVQIFWKKQSIFSVFLYCLALTLTLILANLFKLSGFLLQPIPLFVLLLSREAYTWRRFLILLIMGFLSAVATFVYLYYRNYIPEHTFFFSTAGLSMWTDLFRHSVWWRDTHPFLFVLAYILPIQHGIPRLLPTWNSLWYMYDRDFLSVFTIFLAVLYNVVAPALCFIGCITAYGQRMTKDLWYRFGVVLLLTGALHFLGLIAYMWSTPLLEGYLSNKGVYIASASFSIAYLLSLALTSFLPLLNIKKFTRKQAEYCLLFCTAIFMIVNHLMPDIAGKTDVLY